MAARIRVLLLTDEMEVGGTQRQIAYLARALDRSRFDPAVAYFRNRSFLVEELERAGVPVTELPKRGRIDPRFVRRLVAYLREGRFDVMHCFAFTGELWGTVGRRLLAPSSRPALVTSVRNKYDWYSGLQWRLKRWASLQSCRIVANSRIGGEHAREMMSLPPGSIEVVYNGVADAPGADAPPARPGEPVTALFVGRLVEQKNVPVLLRAMARLRDAGVPLRLRIAGDGPLREACAGQVAELGLSGLVDLMGERPDARALMASSDFVVLPSLREGLSNVILEAMSAGRPVIASAVGGSVELVEQGTTGLLFPSGDDAALARAMGELAADAALREALGAAGRRRAVERFSVDAMARSMEAIYSACAQQRGATAGA
jgi:glycosyltransferase involved in cell wall biosynthesis